MNHDDARREIARLTEEINRHNHAYYVNNSPEISDKEFDTLLRSLEDLERAFPDLLDPLSPTQRVGSDLSQGFEHVFHDRPMMSLANTYSIQEVDEWFDRVRKGVGAEKFEIVGELKFDGTSISLTYRDGRLVRAVTRGDGTRGDDVTANVKTILSIPLVLQPGDWPEEFEIRGEILMPWDVFEKLNAERAYNEEPLFANPRNAASGTLKTQDPREVARRHLDARFYYLLSDNLPYDNHYDNMEAARRWGFKVSKHMKLLHSLEEVDAFIEKWDEERRNLPVATDGLVFKLNSLRQQLNLGFTAKSPRWAVAFKFNPENACTRLRFVSFETGRMGIVTPVANLEPVQLSGTIVKRASLHNDDIIRELDIHEGDWLYVEKGGEIIPKITGVDKSRREVGASPIRFVTKCPECGIPLERIYGEAAWVCPNKYGCRPQITGRIEHFCARRMMNIDGIGEETAELLFNCGLVENIADLYDLTVEKLSGLDRMGEKMASRIVKGIEDSKKVEFERVVYALSIPNVGETTAKRLAKAVKDMQTMRAMSVEELAAVPDVGPIISQGIYDFLRDPHNEVIIDRLARAGVCMQLSEDKLQPVGTALDGKTIVISGVFTHHSRDEYKDIIERNGGKNSGSISKKTSFVLAGENMGPSKREKCEKLGVPILSEDEFLNQYIN
ncbi:MAG: NAD-dependent DNA ligase LigA [Clostridium sp.]|nr:NAD-dependent DNA ligase LigA [Prevotella sp.]MCM1429261.1 NAD-dependent DNA ligase LigA [Clostridium sp.]MCM1475706.1 NAD-dependent DNA ligase LigA [Muribaculaceae bacterium]